MYETFFGLNKRPFASVPSIEQYFPAASIEAARNTLARCVERAAGAGMIVGPSGTGKTLLCEVLAEQFHGSFEVVVLASGRLGSRRTLLQAVLHGMGQPYRGMDEGELRLTLIDFLNCRKRCPEGMLLIVDEAHTLPMRLLEEVRTLTNLSSDGQPRVRLVLAGGPALEEHLANPKLDSLSQRLVSRCYLESFNRSETEDYVYARLDAAGGKARSLLLPEACQAIYQATDGVPRLINQVGDHALLLAFAAQRKRLDRAAIEEAWADLQQLPTPWNANKQPAPSGGTIEFGSLDDDPGESFAGAEANQRVETPPNDLAPCGNESLEIEEQLEPGEQAPAEADDGDLLPEEFPAAAELTCDEPSGDESCEDGEDFAEGEPAMISSEIASIASDPFDEPFQQEEVVVDRRTAAAIERDKLRCAALASDVLDTRFAAGSEAADLVLETCVDCAAASLEGLTCDWSPQRETVPMRDEAAEVEDSDDVETSAEVDDSDEMVDSDEVVDSDEAVEQDAADQDGVEDQEIVVEDEYDAGPVCARPVTAVRGREYRRLFSRLRQG